MEIEIFDRTGRVIGWITSDQDIFIQGNHYVGFIERNEVFNVKGTYLGEFEDGFFWDRHGHAVAFVDGSHVGPATPVTHIGPITPVRPVLPIRPITPVTPVSPVHSMAWSSLTFSIFLSSP